MADAAAFYTRDNPLINHEALQFFAASMFWRGQHIAVDGRQNYSLHRYEPQFRRYLLGLAPFPQAASLWIYIRYRSNLTQVSHGPQAFYGATSTGFSFSIPGLTFQMEVGEYRDYRFREGSFNENGLRPIIDADAADEVHHERLTRLRDLVKASGRTWTPAAPANRGKKVGRSKS